MMYYYTDSEGNIEVSGTPHIKTLEEFSSTNPLAMEYEELSDFPVKVRIGTSYLESETNENGKVSQTFDCLNAGVCDERTLIFRSVTRQNPEYRELKMDYDAGVPHIEFEELYTLCGSCGHTTIQDELKVSLSYGLTLTNDTLLYVGYAYTTTEAGTITPSLGIDGVPSFSYSGDIKKLHYDTSRGVTLEF